LISDKIETRNSRRDVMCIHFDHLTKKMILIGALHGRAAMAGLESSMDGHGDSAGREQMRGEEWNRGRGCWQREEGGTMGVAAHEGLGPLLLAKLCAASSCLLCCCVRKRRKEEREKKRRKGREKGKNGKKFKPGKFMWRKNKR
jgi:hypothetical protein